MKVLTVTGLIVGAALVSGCAGTRDNINAQLDRQAGGFLDGGSFGSATQNNTLVQTGERQHTFDMANRFSQDISSTVNFAFNSSQLDAAARATLMEQANWIKQFPEIRFKVYGHTDLVGSNRYNKSLGLRRARTVVNFLVSQGIDRSRLEAVTSFGETQPLIVTQGRERRNRRTVTEVSGFVQGHPLVLDGKYAEIVYRDYVQSAIVPPTLGGSTDGI